MNSKIKEDETSAQVALQIEQAAPLLTSHIDDLRGRSLAFKQHKALADLERMESDGGDLLELLQAALEALPSSTDSDRPKALLGACIALHEQQTRVFHGVWALAVSMATPAPAN